MWGKYFFQAVYVNFQITFSCSTYKEFHIVGDADIYWMLANNKLEITIQSLTYFFLHVNTEIRFHKIFFPKK